MRILLLVLPAAFLLTACNSNGNVNRTKDKDEMQDENSNSEDDQDEHIIKRKNTASYTWPQKDRDEFFKDCKKISEQELVGEKLNEFCSCLLTRAQWYYPGYAQMNKESSEENDKKIFKECLDEYMPED